MLRKKALDTLDFFKPSPYELRITRDLSKARLCLDVAGKQLTHWSETEQLPSSALSFVKSCRLGSGDWAFSQKNLRPWQAVKTFCHLVNLSNALRMQLSSLGLLLGQTVG